MADGYISQIKTPDNKVYDFRDQHLKVYTGSCTTPATTAIKDVTTDGKFTLAKGAVVFVNFSTTNSAAVGNLKLKFNGEADTNAKPIKYLVNGNDPANIPGAGYLRANQTYMFQYDGTNWVAVLNYYTYSNNFASMVGHYNNILARKAITAESLIVGDATGYEKVASGVTFDLAYPIVWCTANVTANASNYANMYLQHYDRNIATGAKTGFTSSANKVIYLIVTINGNIATIDSNIITDTLPSTADGKVYISLGKLGAQSTGANYFFLYPVHPMFEYKNGKIRTYEVQQNLSEIDGADDLKAIEAISGTTGLLKKTAANTWTLDTSTYLTAHRTYTAFTGKPTGNQTPGFGNTFTIQQISQSTTGQVSGTDRTITIPATEASTSAVGLVGTDAQTFGGTKTFNGGMHIYGSVSMSGTTVTNMYSGGAYHAGHNSLVLHGDSAGVSGIGFTSQKATDSGNAANINSPSDRAFIQYHAYGVTAAAEGNAPTLATSGELGTLVIGVGNDATDTIRLQAPSTAGILHQIGATAYPIPHTTNTNGSVGGTTTPVYVDGGVIKALNYTIAQSVPSDAVFTDHYAWSDITNKPATATRWPAWSEITSKPTTLSGYGITDAKIASGVVTLGSNTITPITSIADLTGSTITAANLRTNLGLSAALRFIGKATTDMSESTTTAPTVTGVTNYVPEVGDVVLDKNSDAEYVCIAKSGTTYTWELLGRSGSWATSTHTHGNITNGGLLGTASMAVVTDGNKKITTADLSVGDSNASTNATTTFVQAVTQNAQGKITVTKASLNTSGTWSGVAGKITNITTSDAASSTDTWRRIWFSYNDNVTGRPAYSDSFAYQTSTGTIKATKFQGALVGNADTATTATYLSNIGRQTNMDIDFGTTTYNSKVFISYADGSTTTHKPPSNAMVFNVAWDNVNNNHYGGQIAMSNSSNTTLYLRGCENGTWDSSWKTVLDSSNYTTYAVAKTAGVTAVTWDATNKKLTRTINGSAADVMTAEQMSTALGLGTIVSEAENSYMKFGGDDTGLGTHSPAATAKSYWADANKVSDNMITGYYNHSGNEYSFLFSKRATYGTILKWGYADRYLRILRIQSGSWKSNDWEKIDAGYADSAGSASYAPQLSQTTITALNSFTHTTDLIYAAAGGSNSVTDKPSEVDAFGVLSYKTADGWYGQILTASNAGSGIYWRTGTTLSGNWKKLLDDSNYTSYALPLSGGTMSGHIFMGGSNASSSTANTTQLVFGTSTTQHIAVTSNDKAFILNPSTSSTTNQIVLYLNKKSKFPSGIEGDVTGDLTGNADTATTTTYIKSNDTRNAALNPSDLTASTSAVRFDFKSKTAIGLTATDVYAGVMSFRPYGQNTDWTGGNAHQIAFNSEGLHWRNGGASWGDWIDLLNANNYSSYAYALDGSNTGTKLLISTQIAAYTNGIQFMNSTTKKGSIGTDNNGTIGIYGTKVVLRPQLDASTKGVEVTTDAMYPTASMTLGTDSKKWSTVYATTFNGNATSADSAKWFMNRGGSTVTISDGPWAHGQAGYGGTNAATVWHQRWKQSGLTYTPSGGSATTLTDSGDMVLWLAHSATSNSLTVNMAIDGLIYAMGGFKGNLTGTASALSNFKVTTTSNLGINAPGTNAIGYVTGLTKAAWNYQQADGALYTQFYNANWIGEIFQDYRTGQISVRGKNNGTWQSWRRVLDETNGATILGLDVGTDNAATLTWGTTYTIAKINGTDIKFTTMAKPTYTYSDVGAAPSSTVSCTTANVKSALGTDTSTTNQWLNKKGGWSTPTAAQVGALASSTVVTNVSISADTTTNKEYALVFGTTPSDGTTPTAAKTEGLQKNITKLYTNPSTGTLYSTKFCVDEHVTLQYNTTDSSLEFVFA